MIGEFLEKYEVLEKIGEGGMATVYRGRHTTLKRIVAVKVLHPHLTSSEKNRLRFAREAQMKVEERAFSLDEAKAADEAFVTSASTFVMPVVEIDGHSVGAGEPGPVAKRLREIYLDESRKAAV